MKSNYHIDEITIDESPRKRIEQSVPELPDGIKMNVFDSGFICGLLEKFRPRKILEVGTFNGGTTAVVLQCMKDLGQPFTMHSIDIMKEFRKSSVHEAGWLGELAAEHLGLDCWHMHAGCILPQVIREIGPGIDFIILDTTHSLPGEALDFVAVFPFLAPGAVVCLHDIRQNQKIPPDRKKIATNVLFHSVAAEKYLNSDPVRVPDLYPNIGAFQINEDTEAYISNVIGTLTQNWKDVYTPDGPMLQFYRDLLADHYPPEALWLFEKACTMNHQALEYERMLEKKEQ